MRRRKAGLFWKCGFVLILSALWPGVSGCGTITQEGTEAQEEEIIAQDTEDDEDEMAGICLDIYRKAAEENRLAEPKTVRSIVERFGECGYSAVDSKNQIDMTGADQAAAFCHAVKQKEAAETVIFQIDYFGGFVKYDLRTKDGSVEVTRSYYAYEDGAIQKRTVERCQAENWTYTKEGYLMFSAVYFSEEMYTLTLSEAEDHVALRVEPLDEKCRELNRKYLQPVGYERNNLFITDWDEKDFGDLDFYDLFDIFYPQVCGNHFPYEPDETLGAVDVYRIPREDFERVIQMYFSIDSETLQSKTVYHQEDSTYEYKPRGIEEAEFPEYPYSEVIGFTQNRDGTITLMVRVVFPYAGDSDVYAHEVTVRPLENGGVQYVSNRIIPSEDDDGITWHTPRLTADEWKELYGGQEWDRPRAEETESGTKDGCLLSETEKRRIQEQVLLAAESVGEIYKDVVDPDAPEYSSGVTALTAKQRKEAVQQLGSIGLVSVEEDTDMQNPEEMENFYAAYQKGRNSMVTVYEIQQDGRIGAVTFIYRDHKLQTYCVGIRWKEGGIPEIQGTSVNDVAEIKLTEKGYFIYAYEYVIAHSSLRQYWRVKPLSEDCRELTKKYISGLSYVNYNLLVTDWNSGNVEDILMPCMYEDIYRIHTGENLETEGRKIPAEEYEKIMTTYFPVSAEQLRENCGYDEADGSYEYEMIFASPYPPFGEVVDYTENADGTITLIVDGVWPDYNSDHAFRNVIVVEPFEDGTFRYLSNSIEKQELDIPVVRRNNT